MNIAGLPPEAISANLVRNLSGATQALPQIDEAFSFKSFYKSVNSLLKEILLDVRAG